MGDIRSHYKLCALKYHPDKCKLENATEKFREIREAYEYLKTQYEDDIDIGDMEDTDHMSDYNTMMKLYLSRFFKHMCEMGEQQDIKTQLIKLVISKLVGLCEKKASEYVRKLDVTTLAKIYDILTRFKDVFHITEQWLMAIKNILTEKTECETCYILNPFLEDLQADNLYKITENGNTYIVPLWHRELVYDNLGKDFVIKCSPVLPEHMEIDDDNDIYVKLKYSVSELWDRDEDSPVIVPFGNTTVSFLPNMLRITKRTQLIRIPGAGISCVNHTDILYNATRSDVILIISIY
jgi:hypothetical protein